MEDILYREVLIHAGLFKNTQIQITLYADRLEIEYSRAMSSKELWEIQRNISYIKKDILYYDKVTGYQRFMQGLPNGLTAYRFHFFGDFKTEKAGKRKNNIMTAIMTMDSRLWYALDSYTPLIPDEERRAAEIEALQNALADPSVTRGTVEIAVGKRMIKTLRLFINDIEWTDYTYPPVRVQLPFGAYRIKIARGVPDVEEGTMDYAYTNEVSVTLGEENPVIHLAAKEGFFSPSMEIMP